MSDAPIVKVFDDGRVEYRASALGGCDMALLAARLGYDAVPLNPNAKIMETFAAGHRIEEEVLATMPWVTYRQQEIYLDVTEKIKVVGHVDGLEFGSDTHLIEIKSQNLEEWERFRKERWHGGFFPKYKWQVSAYMIAFEEPLKLIRALRDKDGSWTGTTDVSYVDEPFYSMADIRARVLRVEAAARTGVLNAECTKSFPCPYFYLHDEIDRELIDDDTVDALAHEYEDARAGVVVAKGRQDAARRALREATVEDKYQTKSGVRVTFYTAKNPPKLERELLDTFLKEHEKSFGDFTTQGESERLRVTLPKEDEDGVS